MGTPPIRLVITDVDNTLYDWLAFYVPSFLAMLEEIRRISGVDLVELKHSFQRVHQRHGTTEYAFAIQEIEALQEADAGLSVEERLKKYDSAIHAFRSVRRRTLRSYPGVAASLRRLKESGVVVVAHSDSLTPYISRRLRQLDLDTFFAAICAPPDHGLPPNLNPTVVRRAREEDVASRTRLIELPPGIRKPDLSTLTPIFDAFTIPAAEAIYVGDSLSRDILMANRAGIRGVWARYGRERDESLYKELRRITYWTEAEVREEEGLKRDVEGLKPWRVIDSFSEVLPLCGLA